MKMSLRRKAFTLVELLIALIIIGILAGALLLTMANAQAKAEATKIVSNMKVIKSAAFLYYSDQGKWYPEISGNLNKQDAGTFLNPYLDSPKMTRYYSGATFTGTPTSGFPQYFVWAEGNVYYVLCNVDDRFENFLTRKALEKLSESMQIFNGDGKGHAFKAVTSPPTYSGNGQVSMVIKDFSI